MIDPQKDYILRGRNHVPGWFSRLDAEIVWLLTEHQNANALDGSLVEIGLHHGKSFIAMCLALQPGQRAYGIDLFERQSLNRDRSGKGSREAVENNLKAAGVDLSRVILDARASTSVTPEDILGSVGAVRFFSIDGGHQIDIVRSDLVLAERVLAPHGIIALDDFLRPEWPDVSAGYFAWFAHRLKPLVPFAIGFNKLYLCDEHQVASCTAVLRSSAFLRCFLAKHYDFCGSEIPVYQKYPQPEWRWRTRMVEYVKLYHPDLYVRLRELRSSLHPFRPVQR